MKVQVKIEITDERIRDLLCCGFEGGVGYWCQIVGYKEPTVLPEVDAEYRHMSYPLTKDGAVVCVETEEEKPRKRYLHRQAVEHGIQVMAEKYPQHFANFMQDNEDAETGDVFIQCCLLGEVVYG